MRKEDYTKVIKNNGCITDVEKKVCWKFTTSCSKLKLKDKFQEQNLVSVNIEGNLSKIFGDLIESISIGYLNKNG